MKNKTNRDSFIRVLPILLVCLLISSIVCSTESFASTAETGVSSQSDVITIGVILPLTGDAAWAGEAIQQIGLYAMEEVNAKGGIDGKQVRLLFEDCGAVSSNAARAAQRLININNANALVGPLFTACLLAVKDIVNSDEMVLIQPTSGNPTIFEDNGYIFSLEAPPEITIKTLTQYLIREKKFRTIALLGRHDDQTLSMINYFKEFWPQYGGDIVFDDTYNATSTDFRTELTRIKNLNPDVIWFNGNENSGMNIVRQLLELVFDESTWIASDYETVGESLLRDFGQYLDGRFSYYMTDELSDEITQANQDKLIEEFTAWGGEITAVTLRSYDCFQILFKGMEDGAVSGPALRESLAAISYFPGVSGYTTFLKNGSSLRPSVMIEYRDGELHRTMIVADD